MQDPPTRARTPRFARSILALAAVTALLGMPMAAHAATVTYHSATRANNSLYMAPTTNTITGGWVTCSGNHSALQAHGRTTNVQGLSIFASATAQNCGPASFTHTSYIGRSGCKWQWTGSGGTDPLLLTCKRYSP